MSGPRLSDDGRFWWDGTRWQPVPRPSGTTSWDITRGILAAVAVLAILLFVVWYVAAVIRA